MLTVKIHSRENIFGSLEIVGLKETIPSYGR